MAAGTTAILSAAATSSGARSSFMMVTIRMVERAWRANASTTGWLRRVLRQPFDARSRPVTEEGGEGRRVLRPLGPDDLGAEAAGAEGGLDEQLRRLGQAARLDDAAAADGAEEGMRQTGGGTAGGEADLVIHLAGPVEILRVEAADDGGLFEPADQAVAARLVPDLVTIRSRGSHQRRRGRRRRAHPRRSARGLAISRKRLSGQARKASFCARKRRRWKGPAGIGEG